MEGVVELEGDTSMDTDTHQVGRHDNTDPDDVIDFRKLTPVLPPDQLNENACDGFETCSGKFANSPMDCSPHKGIVVDMKRTQVGAT